MSEEVKKKIQNILKFALENPYSDFYRKKYKGINSRDFFNLPYLTRAELVATPPFGRLFFDRKSLGWISVTSGTSGSEPLIIFKHSEGYSFLDNIPALTKSLRAAIILCPPSGIVHRYNIFAGRIPAFIGDPYKLKESAVVAAALNVDVIYTAPDMLLKFLEYLEPIYDLKKIRLLQLYGSSLSGLQRELILQKCPSALIVRTYASTEASAIAFQCETLAKQFSDAFHVYSERIFVEIISGEIILTHLRPMPSLLIRYRSGDLGEWLNEKCICGLNAPLIKILGRKDLDKIKVASFEIHRENFAAVIKELPHYLEESFEAHFYQRADRNKIINEIVVKVVPKKNIVPNDIIKTLIEETFNNRLRISSRFSFRDLITQKIFMPITVEFMMRNEEEPRYKSSGAQKLIPHF